MLTLPKVQYLTNLSDKNGIFSLLKVTFLVLITLVGESSSRRDELHNKNLLGIVATLKRKLQIISRDKS